MRSGACSEAEWTARCELAAVYRTLDRLGMNEGICNHLTAMVGPDRFLCIAYGQDWAEVRPESLLLLDPSGAVLQGEGRVEVTAFEIHRALHAANPKSNACVLHTHTPNVTALCCTNPMRLEMAHQNSCRFYGQIAYDETFNGLVDDQTEGSRIAQALGSRSILLHRSHGVMVCAPTIAQAFDDLYYLERAAMVQVMALSSGRPLSLISDSTAAAVRRQFQKDFAANNPAREHLAARMRILEREDESNRRLERIEVFAHAACGASSVVWAVVMLGGIAMGGMRLAAYLQRK